MASNRELFDFQKDPLENFMVQFQHAVDSGQPDPTAMSLATSTREGEPSVRVVLFKGLMHGALSFFTNYDSAKSSQIDQNPKVSLSFYWPGLVTQIRISGSIEKTSRTDSVEYFKTRPRLSQLGAWASKQSHVIADYSVLETRLKDVTKKFEDPNVVIPCPENWGGYLIHPKEFEFWFGQEGRLHFRYLYTKINETSWKRRMLSP